jgi:hypothetical protein
MADSFLKTNTSNGQEIIFDVPSELSYWAKKFNVPRSRLKEATKAVGPVAKDVEAWLARN